MTRRQVALLLFIGGIIATSIILPLFDGVYLTGDSTSAQVKRIKWIHDRYGSSCAPILEYTVGGTTYEEQSRFSTVRCPFEVGETVTAYYPSGEPDAPWVLCVDAFTVLMIPLGLFAAAAYVAFRKPKTIDRVNETAEVALADAAEDQVIKLRGRLRLDDGQELVVAPLTGRPCVACWTRVTLREVDLRDSDKPDRRIEDELRWAGFVVEGGMGTVRVAATTAVKAVIDADASGDTETKPFPELEDFLVEHFHSRKLADTSSQHFIWYQGLFQADEEVFVVGHVHRHEGSTAELVAKPDEPVAIEHVDREARKEIAHTKLKR